MLSEKGKNASEPRDTPLCRSSHARFSSFVKTSGFTLKISLPGAVAQHVVGILADVDVDRVVAVRALDAVHERKVQDLRALTEEPVVRLASGEAHAVHAGLLSGADADRLSVLRVADGIGLRIFQRDEGDEKVPFRLGSGMSLFSVTTLSRMSLSISRSFLALLKGNAEDILVLERAGLIGRIDLDHVVIAVLFLLFRMASASSVYPGAITPSETSCLMRDAVDASQGSLSEMKSPKELMRSAPRALA